MSWLFSQALVGAYSEASSLDGTPSAPSNTMPTPQAFLSRDKTTDAWNRFPSGMTCEPLTESRGEELLTWFRAGFLAKTLVPPARALESPASSQDCGVKWRELSVKFDRNTSSWKTVRCLLSEDLPWSLVTLPKWGMMRAGELWERAMSALHTAEIALGSLATPTARDWKDCGTKAAPPSRPKHSQQTLGQQLGVKVGLAPQPAFAEWMMGWPIGWTDLKPLATHKFQQWLLSHGVCLQGQPMNKEAA